MIRNPAKSGLAGKARFKSPFRGAVEDREPGIQKLVLDSGSGACGAVPE
jgi:hypothetical protein